MKMEQQLPEVFFGPVFCASLYSHLHNTPPGLAISKETDTIKQLKIALTAVLGDDIASTLNIGHIISGESKQEVSDHINKFKQLLPAQMDFDIKQTPNFDVFYSPQGIPRGFYIEGLSPEVEKSLNNLFIKQHLIIPSVEMKALGFNGSDPHAALNKITSVKDRIVLTAKDGSVCVIAESEKLQKLQRDVPESISISHAQIIAILYKSGFNEEKYETSPLKSLRTIKPTPTQLSEALSKLSIECHVDSEDSENWKILALLQDHVKMSNIYDECLQFLDPNLCRALYVETYEETITPDVLAEWLGNDNFALFPGPTIIADSSGLKKIRELQIEWLDIDSDHLNLLKCSTSQNEIDGDYAKKIVEKLREQTVTIIPQESSLEVREDINGDFKISIPSKYKNAILKKLEFWFSEHILAVTPEVMKILYQQTGMREIKPAFAKLQQDERVGKGFVTLKNNQSYLVFSNEEDIDKFESYWVRSFISVSSLCKTVVKMHAKTQGCRSDDFEPCCHYLKIIAEHPAHYFNFRCLNFPTMIKIDSENIKKLNKILDDYVSITPQVRNFIITLLPQMRESDSWQQVEESKEYVIAKPILEKIFEAVLNVIPPICKSTRTGKIITKQPFIPHDNEIWDTADLKQEETQSSFAFVILSQLEMFISTWKMQNNYVPLEYQTLPHIRENPGFENDTGRRSSSIDIMGENMQRFMPFRKSTQISSSDGSLNLLDSKTSSNTEFSAGSSAHSSTDSSLDPTPPSSRQPSPGSDLRKVSNHRLIGGSDSGSKPSNTSQVTGALVSSTLYTL